MTKAAFFPNIQNGKKIHFPQSIFIMYNQSDHWWELFTVLNLVQEVALSKGNKVNDLEIIPIP